MIETEYISREAVLAKAYWHGDSCIQSNPYPDGVEAVDVSAIEQIPTADVRPVVMGKWEDETGYIFSILAQRVYCPVCKSYAYFSPMTTKNFCPNCGADMREISDGDNQVSCEFD